MAEKEKEATKSQKPASTIEADDNPLANTAFAAPGTNLKVAREESLPEDQIAPLVASPTGPQPLSAMTSDPKRAKEIREGLKERIRKERAHPRAGQVLDEETVEAMSSAERRAVARQRGYDLKGRRVSVEQFMKLQQEDEGLDEPEAPRGAKRRKTKKD